MNRKKLSLSFLNSFFMKEVNNMAKGSSKTFKVARSAKTGKFVKKSYAKNHKNTTVVETMKKSTGKKKK
jgi:hypothetical protein